MSETGGRSSFQSLDRLGRRGDMKDDSAEILFQSFLQEAIVSRSDMDRDVQSLMLSIRHFLCRPRRRPPSKVPLGMILERLSYRVTCPNYASFRLLTVARRGSCGPTGKLILLLTQSLVDREEKKRRRRLRDWGGGQERGQGTRRLLSVKLGGFRRTLDTL